MGCEAPNKNAIKVTETWERAYILNFGWCGPVLDARDFDGVHACHPPSKDHPQVVHFRSVKEALLEGEEKIMGLCDR